MSCERLIHSGLYCPHGGTSAVLLIYRSKVVNTTFWINFRTGMVWQKLVW